MQIPLIEGRLFNDGDTRDSTPVVVVDQYLVNRYFPGKSGIGRQIQRGGQNNPPWTIVGVVGTINSIDLAQPVIKERIYYPVTQAAQPRMAVILKTTMDPTTLVAALREAVLTIDPDQPISDVRTMDQWVSRSLEVRRAPMVLLALFGGVALVLSAIGIYGVLAFGVAQRVREFGIRQALGADRQSILSLVLGQGMRTVGVGVALGLGGAYALSRFLETLLFGVQPHDMAVFAGVTVLLLLVAVLACYLPARRATEIDPMTALRDA